MRVLARWSSRHRWWVLGVWVVVVVGVSLAGQRLGGGFTDDLSINGSDSEAAHDLLGQELPDLAGDSLQVVLHDPAGVDRPDVRRAVDRAVTGAGRVDGVARAQSPYAETLPMVSSDGTTAVATVRFADRAKDIDPAAMTAVEEAFEPVRDLGVQVELGGSARNTESGPSGSEVVGLAAAVVVLLVAFGSVLAMAVPLVSALLALGLGMGVIHLLTGQLAIGTAGPVVAAMIGLGVGIDYALLVVTRHREGLASGLDVEESVETALVTAGRSVLVAGATVVVAILSLYLIGIPFVATLGLASALTVTATLLASVTLLPALLTLLGDRLVVRRRRRRADGRGWTRWTERIQRRPWPYLLAAVALLGLMAWPATDLRLGTADASSAAPDTTERRAFDLVAGSFGSGWTGPLLVTATVPQGEDAATAAEALRADLASLPGVASVTPPAIGTSGRTGVLTVVPESTPDAQATEDLVHRIRSDAAGTDDLVVHVGGPTATSIDLADTVAERLPWFMAVIVGLSGLLLLVEFRSLFVPVKAALMNLVSVGAAYGAVVAVFQWGWLAPLVGAEPGPIESFAPMMLFAVLFGLSMDYEVFLLSRVREEYLATGDPGRAVSDGVGATARVITAAASVMVVVFASFLLNDQRVVNLFGFGLAVAILVDATVVRLVLVPAVMALAGHRAWYLPAWLGRLLPGAGHRPAPARAPDPVTEPTGGV